LFEGIVGGGGTEDEEVKVAPQLWQNWEVGSVMLAPHLGQKEGILT